MAGDWIKMRADLFTHPKVVRIASALKADTLRTVGGLMSVWCLFDSHSEDGHLDGYTPEVLDSHLRWDGFAEAMMVVGWLEHDEGRGLNLPRFDAHNGQSSKRRAMDTERKREIRKVSASDADKKRTREEKRREEYLSPTGDNDNPDKPGLIDACPHQQIIDLYHELLPTGRQVREWTPARAAALRSRWRENPKRQNLDWWRRFFNHCAKSAFLTGRVTSPGRKPFEVSLDWLVKSENLAKVVEGAYHEEEREAA